MSRMTSRPSHLCPGTRAVLWPTLLPAACFLILASPMARAEDAEDNTASSDGASADSRASDPKAGTVLDLVATRMHALKGWSANYRQIRGSSLLENPTESRGRISVLQPDRIRWDQSEPVRSVMTLKGPDGLVYFEELSRAKTFRLSRQWSPEKFLLPGTEWQRWITRNFQVNVQSHEPRRCVLQLVPLKRSLKKRIKQVDLTLQPGEWFVQELRVEQAGDEYLRVELTDIDTANLPAPAIFEFVPPRGTETVDVKDAHNILTGLAP